MGLAPGNPEELVVFSRPGDHAGTFTDLQLAHTYGLGFWPLPGTSPRRYLTPAASRVEPWE